MSNKKIICPYFLKNECIYGSNCWYSHDVSMIDNSLNIRPAPINFKQQSSKTCTYFLENRCTYKDCAFFHGYCDRLQHVKIIDEHTSEINNLVKMDDTKYISSDIQAFYVRFSGNSNNVKKTINQGYKIGKLIFSSDKAICAVQKEGM
jgi:hypothetical protein